MWKINFLVFFFKFLMPLITSTLNCLMVTLPYAVRVVQSASHISKAFLVEPNIAQQNLLETEIDISFVTAALLVLHLTCTIGLVLLPLCLLVSCVLWGSLVTFASLVCCVLLCGVYGLIGGLVCGRVTQAMLFFLF